MFVSKFIICPTLLPISWMGFFCSTLMEIVSRQRVVLPVLAALGP
jgi:hypothetical protein